jgi:HlyD family secretion protein
VSQGGPAAAVARGVELASYSAPAMSINRRIVRILLPVILLGGGLGYWRYRAHHRPPEVQFKAAPVERRHIVGRVTASGTLSALVTVQVGTQVSGRVQMLSADFNSSVRKGELVAKIDAQLFEAAEQQAQANYQAAKAGVATAEASALNADKQYARTKALRDQNLAAQADLDTAEANVATSHAAIDAAKAGLAQALASLHQAQVNLSYTNIVSPIDGVVISRNVDVGQTVAASLSAPTLFTIAQDLTKMQVDTNVAEGDVGRLQVGMKTYFTVDSFPGQRFLGKIRQIRNSATTVQNVVTYDAVIDVDNTDLRLRPGMTANVTVVYAERRGALAVSNAALRFRAPPSLAGGLAASPSSDLRPPRGAAPTASAAGSKTLWVMRGAVPQSVSVHSGLTDGTVTEIVDGDLREGDQVVVDTTSVDVTPTATATSTSLRRLF